jgi:ABC-type transport system involved in multi-copper enzyme maturation permease subunit
MIQNPVLRKELMVKLRLRRGAHAQNGVIIAIILLIGIFHLYFIDWLLKDNQGDNGRTTWAWFVCLQYTLICLMTPAVAANAITQEREQQTWDMLIFTRLTPMEIIFGKLMGRLLPSLGLLILCFPLTLMCVIVSYLGLDGSWSGLAGAADGQQYVVTPGEFFGAYAVMFLTAICFTTLGLFLSHCTRRTLYALMLSYTIVVGGLLIGTMMLTGALQMFVRDFGFFERFPLLWINPAYLMMQVMSPVKPYGGVYLMGGLILYLVFTLLMIWRMIAGFRRFSTE